MDIVTLLETLVNDLLKAEASFFENPKEFSRVERAAKTSTESFAASFLGLVLSEMNEKICNNGWRKDF